MVCFKHAVVTVLVGVNLGGTNLAKIVRRYYWKGFCNDVENERVHT